MKRIYGLLTWVLALLLASFLTGCAATTNTVNWANQPDRANVYTAIYSDGKRMVAAYASDGLGAADRWTEIDVGSLKWGPLYPNGSMVYNFTADDHKLKPANIAGLQKISLYGAPYVPDKDIRARLAQAGIQTFGLGEMTSGDPHRNDPARQPFTAYITGPGSLFLIRDDPNRPGELQALSLRQDVGPNHPGRALLVPAAVALDIVTFPLQVLWFGAAFVAFQSHSG